MRLISWSCTMMKLTSKKPEEKEKNRYSDEEVDGYTICKIYLIRKSIHSDIMLSMMKYHQPLLKSLHEKLHFLFPNVLKRWFFQKTRAGIWSFLLYYLERWYFFSQKIWYFFFGPKMKDYLYQKNTWKYNIFCIYV